MSDLDDLIQGNARANPFYHNYVFSKADIERSFITWRDRLWIWMLPTYVQVNYGYAWHFKTHKGRIWFVKAEKVNPEKDGGGNG